ncbi:hypothetical protein LG202_26740 [Methylobacillus methanolivorans]|uniref:DUF1289 domain-containing protein n=1 Tax=Methylobacillus methanolivorans TaxID=1848927 RepID=A0ABW8GP08_9PROT
MQSVPQVASPCIGVCALDSERQHCTGCWRTLEEIRGWRTMSDRERLQVLKVIEARRPTAKH